MLKIITYAMIFTAVAVTAADNAASRDIDELKLPNGRILKHPYIMNKTPTGVAVAHDEGAKFIKYKDMPVDVAKKLGYSPKSAQKYEEKLKKRRQQQAVKKAREAEAKKKYDALYKKRMQKYRIHELERKIKEYKVRIKRLEYEIPRLEKDKSKFRDEAVDLSKPAGGNSGTCFWRGGFVANSSSRRSEHRKRYKVVSSLGNEYSKISFRLEEYKDEFERKSLEIEEMENQLAAMKKKSGQNGFFSKLF
ncbi:hypothetical protein P0136_00670 [Lentisphaerota bacterium ZTH]|nr:hypothetical protein JYG24_08185 [Lentisphaerota bacterium]WET06528.1 hypothetical protein P0136_00670 [Lentisphaerota bacterium ZTH]